MIRSITPSADGRTFTVQYGTSEVRDLSDGRFPVELWRINLMCDGTNEEKHARTVTKFTTLRSGLLFASRGWRAGANRSYVEIRTPKSRQAVKP